MVLAGSLGKEDQGPQEQGKKLYPTSWRWGTGWEAWRTVHEKQLQGGYAKEHVLSCQPEQHIMIQQEEVYRVHVGLGR